jgi:hypothetical protein
MPLRRVLEPEPGAVWCLKTAVLAITNCAGGATTWTPLIPIAAVRLHALNQREHLDPGMPFS